MKTEQYLVIPEAGNPHGYFIIDRKKSLKLYVKKAFKDDTLTYFNYQFFHLDGKGHKVSKRGYGAISWLRSVTKEDNVMAATWFLTEYFSYRELHYCFPEYTSCWVGGYYAVLGKPLPKSALSLVWE